MFSQKMDEYLDGSLNAAERAEVESTIARDPQAARVLARARSERALRRAAFDTYLPTEHEARSLAAQVMAEATSAPVGRVGMWMRRGAAVAAGLIILTCTFIAGQGFAPTKYVMVPGETKVVYNVVYTDSSGATMVNEFASSDERNAFVKQLEQQGASSIVVADLTTPNHF